MRETSAKPLGRRALDAPQDVVDVVQIEREIGSDPGRACSQGEFFLRQLTLARRETIQLGQKLRIAVHPSEHSAPRPDQKGFGKPSASSAGVVARRARAHEHP